MLADIVVGVLSIGRWNIERIYSHISGTGLLFTGSVRHNMIRKFFASIIFRTNLKDVAISTRSI